MNDYLVIYEQAPNGDWGAYCPDVDGVAVGGNSRGEVERLMAEALPSHLTWLREVGKDVPPPRSRAGLVAA